MSRSVLILGCGYVGTALARRLRERGFRVLGWVRTAESAAALRAEGIATVVGDLTDGTVWERVPRDFDAVVHCAATRGGGVPDYQAVYLEGVARAQAHLPQARLLFVSSTSVYGQVDGSWVTETSPAEPEAETSRVLRVVEDQVLAANGIVFRAAGIYGPDRSVLLKKYIARTAVIDGDGSRWLNQIHRDDLAEALYHGLHVRPGEIYNVADREPIGLLNYYRWLSARLGGDLPPFGPADPARKRGKTNKRVSNQKLESTGWRPRYRTFREGLDEVLQTL